MRKHKMLILGRSGSGKSLSIRNLDPKKTGIINCDRQELMFPSGDYNTIYDDKGKPDLSKSNYVETSKPSSVITTLNTWDKSPHIETVVIDTITHLITSYYITDALGKEYGGYKELGTSFWNIINTVRRMNKNIIVFGHLKTEFNDDGIKEVTMKSHGKMIKEFEAESYFNILMLAEAIKREDKLEYVFRTEPNTLAEKIKAPVKFNEDGTLTRALDKYVPNDLADIFTQLDKFYS
jgi:hypothetical protein